MSYFVTGLPRSRTAWFSEWLPDCLHEGFEGCYTHKEYIKKLGKKGDSNSALMFFPIERYFPKAPVVIVERNFDEVIFSLEKIGLFNNDVYKAMEASCNRLKRMKGMRVDFHSLPLREIWEYLIGTEFNKKEAETLDKMNIQHVNYNPDVQAFNSFIGER